MNKKVGQFNQLFHKRKRPPTWLHMVQYRSACSRATANCAPPNFCAMANTVKYTPARCHRSRATGESAKAVRFKTNKFVHASSWLLRENAGRGGMDLIAVASRV
jgi:hypothetical protein